MTDTLSTCQAHNTRHTSADRAQKWKRRRQCVKRARVGLRPSGLHGRPWNGFQGFLERKVNVIHSRLLINWNQGGGQLIKNHHSSTPQREPKGEHWVLLTAGPSKGILYKIWKYQPVASRSTNGHCFYKGGFAYTSSLMCQHRAKPLFH